jgi:hypothetical protein
MRSMTGAHLRANWSGVPSLNQPWLVALLRAFAMLVLCAASTVRMRFSLFSGECHTDAEPEMLPEPASSPTSKETTEAATNSKLIVKQPAYRAASIDVCIADAAAIGGVDGGGGSGGGGDDFTFRQPGRQPGSRPGSVSDVDDDSVWSFPAEPVSRSRFRSSREMAPGFRPRTDTAHA